MLYIMQKQDTTDLVNKDNTTIKPKQDKVNEMQLYIAHKIYSVRS
jgi:hypothetical protein